MRIRILQLVDGAREASGLTVVIDVFRAFSVACYLVDRGIQEILPVAGVEEARALKAAHPEYLLVGEVGGQRPEGFDHGNSPSELEAAVLSARTAVQRTSAGTQGLVSATRASELITGSFVNAPAVVDFVRARTPEDVSLVCMGQAAREPADEDTACAEFIRTRLQGGDPDFEAIRAALRTSLSARRFFDPEKTWAPERDFALCLDLGRFDFVLRAEREQGRLALRRLDRQAWVLGRGTLRRITGFRADDEGHWLRR